MTTTQTEKPALNKYGYNTIARNTSLAIFTSLPLFLAAGRWDWGWAWVYTAVSVIGWTALNIYVSRHNPALMNDRGRRTKTIAQEAKRWDMVILSIYSLFLFVVPIVAGLDQRYGWSTSVSPLVNLFGIALMVIGFVPLTWGMASNRYFQPMVIINPEGGQRVADGGAYKIVRHPGYVGVILHFLAVPFAVGAWAALIPALLGAGLFILRTAREDAALQAELPGYREFAGRTRYRLLPGVW